LIAFTCQIMENYECIQQMQTIDPTTSIGSIKKKKFTKIDEL